MEEEKILDAIMEGIPISRIARKYGMTAGQVYDISYQNGVLPMDKNLKNIQQYLGSVWVQWFSEEWNAACMRLKGVK